MIVTQDNTNVGHERGSDQRIPTPTSEHSYHFHNNTIYICFQSLHQTTSIYIIPGESIKMAEPSLWSQHSKKLAGGWKCISFEVFNGSGPDKRIIGKPHGDNPMGRVYLSPKGYLFAQVTGQGFYAGPIELLQDDQGLFWKTTLDIGSKAEIVGTVEERRVEYFEKDGKAFMVLQPVRDMVLEVRLSQISSFPVDWADVLRRTGRRREVF